MASEERTARMRRVLTNRLSWVRVAVEAVYHRHNVSAILRTCDAMGVHNVHLVERHFKAAQGAARGAERWLSIHCHPGPMEAMTHLQQAGYQVWVADLDDTAVPPEEVPLDRPVCLWLGAELEGVGPDVRAACDGVVCVPMRGFAQSLNVSVAAALSLRPIAERARARGPTALLDAAERQATWDRWMERVENVDTGAAARAALRWDGPLGE